MDQRVEADVVVAELGVDVEAVLLLLAEAELSGGARQKLNLALALLGDPPLALLDEP